MVEVRCSLHTTIRHFWADFLLPRFRARLMFLYHVFEAETSPLFPLKLCDSAEQRSSRSAGWVALAVFSCGFHPTTIPLMMRGAAHPSSILFGLSTPGSQVWTSLCMVRHLSSSLPVSYVILCKYTKFDFVMFDRQNHRPTLSTPLHTRFAHWPVVCLLSITMERNLSFDFFGVVLPCHLAPVGAV